MKHKKTIICVLLSLALCGCQKEAGSIETEADRNTYCNSFDTALIASNDAGIYYIKDAELFYKEDGKQPLSLGYMNFVDGKAVKPQETYTMQNNASSIESQDLVIAGNRIYMQFTEETIDGSRTRQLCSVDLKGSDFQTDIVFDEVPQKVIINKGKFYVQCVDFEKQKKIYYTYDSQFKVIDTQEYDMNSGSFYIENDQLVVMDSAYTIYDNGTLKLSFTVEDLASTSSNGNGEKKITGIYDNGSVHKEFTDQLVLFVNDQYFYTSTCKSPQTYSRYLLDGTLDKSITVNTQITSEGNTGNAFFDNDFSFILKLRNENEVLGSSAGRYFTCSFDSEKCEYLYD